MNNQHATVIQWKNKGLMFIGPSGSGKSTLALELIEHGATLVADDQVFLHQQDQGWIATCPASIENRLHIDGIGLLYVSAEKKTFLDCIFQSVLPAPILSQPPEINLPIITMDFMSANAIQFIVNCLTSFDSASCIS